MTWLSRMRTVVHVQRGLMIEYRAELVLWALSNSLSFILMGVWYEASLHGKLALQPLEVIRYFLAVFVVRQLTIVWVVWEMEADLQAGKLDHMLLQPMDPVWRSVASHLAERIVRFPFVLLLLVLFFLVAPQAWFVPAPMDALLTLLFSLAAFALRFLLQHTVAMLLFYTERATSVEGCLFAAYIAFGGAMVPLDVLPDNMRTVLLWTPFPYLLWLPARLLVGDAPVNLVHAAFSLSAWFAVLLVVNRLLWRRGLVRYQGMGA
jgi:ABC-2 type transport system permease protein